MSRWSSLLLSAAVVCVALCLAATPAKAQSALVKAQRPVLYWTTENSLDVAADSATLKQRADVHEELSQLFKTATHDLLILLDHAPNAHKLKSLTALSALTTESQQPTTGKWRSTESIVGSFVGIGEKFEIVVLRAHSELTSFQRTKSTKPYLFVVDVHRFGGIDNLLPLLKPFFSSTTEPFTAVYAGEHPPAGSVSATVAAEAEKLKHNSGDRFLPRIGRDKVVYGPGEVDPRGLFQRYTFFSAAIWMGIVVVIIVLGIVIAGFAGLNSLQTPSHFEKKPHLGS